MSSLPGTWSYQIRERLRALRVYTGMSASRTAGGASGKATLLRVEGFQSRNVYLDLAAGYCLRMGQPLEALLCEWVGCVPPTGPVARDTSDDVRERLREFIETIGLRELARRANVEHSTLARWASGEYRRIDLVRLERIARAASVDPARLVLGP